MIEVAALKVTKMWLPLIKHACGINDDDEEEEEVEEEEDGIFAKIILRYHATYCH